MFTVKFEPKAQEELDKLPSDIIQRIVDKLTQSANNPDHFLEKLKGIPEYKIRIGDYRVILLIDRNAQKLKIQAVGHRKNIYKKYKTD